LKALTKQVIFFFIILHSAFAQYLQYPKDYFMFPIKPGQQNYLSGVMGELRTNHFHGGLDIKTDQKTGLPVHAAADGYISRIVVSSKGYGNTLYIIHPNGLMTVYAHLEWPAGKIGRYLKDYLYKQHCNETDMLLFPGEMVVKKGDTIALSGNSGSSGGPHLHFEIRDAKETLMNPLFFDFPEIKDNMKPYVNKLALRTLDINSRVEGEFGRFEFIPIKDGSDYELRYPIHASGILGLELIAYDHMNNTSNQFGLSLIEVKLDGREIFVHDIQKISFDDNPYINHHIDFQTFKLKGNYFQKCYIADGNCLNTYCSNDPMNGRLLINDGLEHKVEVKLYDAYRNFTTLRFRIRGVIDQKPVSLVDNKMKIGIKHEEYENTLKISVWGNPSKIASIYSKGNKVELPPAYFLNKEQVYLWDLRKALPDSLEAGELKYKFLFDEVIPSVGDAVYAHKNMDIKFPKKSIFDTLFLDLDYNDGIYYIHNHTTALFSPLIITLKPEFDIPNKTKTSVYNISGRNSLRYASGEWTGNTVRFRTKYLGNFTIKTDTIPPVLHFRKKVGNTLFFHVGDQLSGIANWYGYLDGKFILLQYDPKYDVLFTNTQYGEAISGELIIGVIDNLGNKNQQKFRF
jgi:hypothetical protein